MKVLKFGGSSVGSATGLLQAKKVIESNTDDIIVVVSALGGITDKLISTAKTAAKGDISYEDGLEEIKNRHNEMIKSTVIEELKEQTREKISVMLGDLSNIFKGVFLIKDLSDKTLDAIVSYGERLSSVIVAGTIRNSTLFTIVF